MKEGKTSFDEVFHPDYIHPNLDILLIWRVGFSADQRMDLVRTLSARQAFLIKKPLCLLIKEGQCPI